MRATWIVAAAAVAAAGCSSGDGPSGGADPWRGGPTPPAVVDGDHDGVPMERDCDDADPAVFRRVEAYVDADHDGHGAGAPRTICAGTALPVGSAADGTDCDDGDPRGWTAFTVYADEDQDGLGAGDARTFCTGGAPPAGWAPDAGDCAPLDVARWRELAYGFRDADGDLATVPDAGKVCAGAALPPGYLTLPLKADCDDADPARHELAYGFLDADHDGHGTGSLGEFCVGILPAPGIAFRDDDCAPDDATRWQLLSYEGTDTDGDGYVAGYPGTVCAGAALPGPYVSWSRGTDCDDADPLRWQVFHGYADTDRDAVGAGPLLAVCSGWSREAGYVDSGDDCAPDDPARWRSHDYRYRDADGDGRTISQLGSVCEGAALPSGYATAPSGNDCDDADSAVWLGLPGWRDGDGDGVGEDALVVFCTSGALPDGWSTVGGDCASGDPAHWRLASYAGYDRDGDGHTTREPGQLCIGTALPDPYRSAAAGNDCDDGDRARYRWVVLYRDVDGDGVGAGSRSIPCLGDEVPAGWSVLGFDADDADSTVHARDDVSAPIVLDL